MTANRPIRETKRRSAVIALFVLVLAAIDVSATSVQPRHIQTSHGGTTTWHLNAAVLDMLSIHVTSVTQNLPQRISSNRSRYENLEFAAVDADAFRFTTSDGLPRALVSGALAHSGGFALEFPGGTANLQGFELRPRASAPFALDVADHEGHVWFTLDHGHYLLEDKSRTFALRYMNLRISSYFAEKLQHPEVAGLEAGGMDALSPLASPPIVEAGTCSAPWPNQGGAVADIKMIYQSSDAESGLPDTIHFMRCGLPNGSGSYTVNACTTTDTSHYVVFAPDTSLENVGTAEVPWHKMFTGPYAPYNNDQHPFLVWNLYRVNADGSLQHIAASGAKHAFNTINKVCGCNDGQNSYPTCEDSYSYFSNDLSNTNTLPNYLGPRSEIIPATGQWGRCDSVFDSNCDGVLDSDGGAQDDFEYRVVVPETDIIASMQPGASFYFEYWYVVRDQANIYDAMGYRPLTFSKSTTTAIWSTSPGTFVNGPVINAWVSPTAPPAGAMNQEVATPEGRARLALTTTSLGAGLYRYNYALMNLDFARTVIDPAHATEPNMHLLSDDGFNSFTLPLSSSVTITDVAFTDVDHDSTNDWSYTRTANGLQWKAPAGHPLNWATLYAFSFTANLAPLAATAQLGVSTAGSPSSYAANTLAPLTNEIFGDGFGDP